jgi:hypothetical protein
MFRHLRARAIHNIISLRILPEQEVRPRLPEPNNAFTTDFSDQSDGPIQQYWTCISVPTIAQLDQKGLLTAYNSEYVRQFVPANSNSESLQNVTAAVTQCLTDTCNSARHSQICADACSPVKLLTDSTTPNLDGISNCLFTMCSAGSNSLPFANTDITGIGVSDMLSSTLISLANSWERLSHPISCSAASLLSSLLASPSLAS